MIAYKGFRPGMICIGYQFQMGLNVTEKANCRQNGFHCAEDPLDCLSYYSDVDHSEYYNGEAVLQTQPVREPPEGKAGAPEVSELPGAVKGSGIVIDVTVDIQFTHKGKVILKWQSPRINAHAAPRRREQLRWTKRSQR